MTPLAAVIDMLVRMRAGEAAVAEEAVEGWRRDGLPDGFDVHEATRARDLAVAASGHWRQLAELAALESGGYSGSGAPSPVAAPAGGTCG